MCMAYLGYRRLHLPAPAYRQTIRFKELGLLQLISFKNYSDQINGVGNKGVGGWCSPSVLQLVSPIQYSFLAWQGGCSGNVVYWKPSVVLQLVCKGEVWFKQACSPGACFCPQ